MGPVTPANSILSDRVSANLLRATVEAGQRAHPELASRLQRAAGILLLGRLRVVAEGVWEVESEQRPGEWYRCTADGCTCVDFQRRREPCKHLLAIGLLFAVEERARHQQRASEPHPAPAPVSLTTVPAPRPKVRWTFGSRVAS